MMCPCRAINSLIASLSSADTAIPNHPWLTPNAQVIILQAWPCALTEPAAAVTHPENRQRKRRRSRDSCANGTR
jgi:hypothetical protein